MSAGLGTLVLTVALDNSTILRTTRRKIGTVTTLGFEGMARTARTRKCTLKHWSDWRIKGTH